MADQSATQTVPVEPTLEMVRAGAIALESYSDAFLSIDPWASAAVAYKAMIESARACNGPAVQTGGATDAELEASRASLAQVTQQLSDDATQYTPQG